MEPLAFEQFETLERNHWWFRGRRRVYLGLIERHLGGTPIERALDLGAGAGGFLPGLARLARRVWPADSDPRSLAACGRRELPANVAAPIRSSCEALPFEDSSFDLVCLFDVLEHIDDDIACLREVRRVLRPGGSLFASVPAYPALYSGNDRIADHKRRYTRSCLANALEQAGLGIERNTHTNVLLFPLILPAVLATKTWELAFERGQQSKRTNLSWPLPGFAHALLYRAFAAELPLSARIDLPLGHSIAAIAKRKP